MSDPSVTRLRPKILVVDDDKFISRQVIESITSFEWISAATVADGVRIVRKANPDIVLHDYTLPDGTAVDGCTRIREISQVPILIISSQDKLDNRLAAYNAGASDYILKPLVSTELRMKIEFHLKMRDEIQINQQKLTDARKAAMEAVTNVGQLGILLKFMQAIENNEAPEAMSQAILTTLSEFHLSSAIQVRTRETVIDLNSTQVENPLESEIFRQLGDQPPIVDFGNRTIFNNGGVSILVKNMPQDDPEKCAKLKENVGFLCEAADARLQHMLNEIHFSKQTQSISKVLSRTQVVLGEIQKRHEEMMLAASNVLTSTQQDVEDTLYTLDLTEEQEMKLHSLVNKGIERALEMFTDDAGVARYLKFLASELDKGMSKINNS